MKSFSSQASIKLLNMTATSALKVPLPKLVQEMMERTMEHLHIPESETSDTRFTKHSFANGYGARDYHLYVPTKYSGQSVPLVVMLHGCTQNPADFAVGTRMNEWAETHNFIVIYPAQPQSANSNKCWNWYRSEDQHKDAGEPSIIAGITRRVIQGYNIDQQRVYVAGMSAGGAMAAIMALEYPDLYAALGVHSGLPAGSACDIRSAFCAMRTGAAEALFVPYAATPTIVFHGSQDNVVNVKNAANFVQGDLHHLRINNPGFDGGRPYTRELYKDKGKPAQLEVWTIENAGHTWSGGDPKGSHTDPLGPDASKEIVRFFLEHKLRN